MAPRRISKRLRKNRRKSQRSQRGGQVAQIEVTTLAAGSGAAGFADGKGRAAIFNNPDCVAVDSAGNVYVGDTNNHRIRKITPLGEVTTLAGNGKAGNTNGVGVNASFNYPWGVAVDSANNVYVADTGNSMIRKISPDGTVKTFAGNGKASFADGPGPQAMFQYPRGIAIDKEEGTVYVADTNNQRIRKISYTGDVSTLAGTGDYNFADGPGKSAKFQNPYGIAIDSKKRVYVTDTFNQLIRVIQPDGTTSTLAGAREYSFADGNGKAARFRAPSGIAVDAAGNVYVGDQGNNRIRKITADGVVTTLAGTGGAGSLDGAGKSATFKVPHGVAVDSSGRILVADSGNNTIRAVLGALAPTVIDSVRAAPTLTVIDSVRAAPTLTVIDSVRAAPTPTVIDSVRAALVPGPTMGLTGSAGLTGPTVATGGPTLYGTGPLGSATTVIDPVLTPVLQQALEKAISMTQSDLSTLMERAAKQVLAAKPEQQFQAGRLMEQVQNMLAEKSKGIAYMTAMKIIFGLPIGL